MTLRWFVVLAAPVALLAASPARAQSSADSDPPDPGIVLGGQIADMCLVGTGPQSLMCSAFLRGTFEGLMFGQISATGGMVSFCLPAEGVSLGDLRDTFLDYLDDEPDRRTEEAGMLLLDSLQDRYPCDNAGDDGPMYDDPGLLSAPDRTALVKPHGWKLARRH